MMIMTASALVIVVMMMLMVVIMAAAALVIMVVVMMLMLLVVIVAAAALAVMVVVMMFMFVLIMIVMMVLMLLIVVMAATALVVVMMMVMMLFLFYLRKVDDRTFHRIEYFLAAQNFNRCGDDVCFRIQLAEHLYCCLYFFRIGFIGMHLLRPRIPQPAQTAQRPGDVYAGDGRSPAPAGGGRAGRILRRNAPRVHPPAGARRH